MRRTAHYSGALRAITPCAIAIALTVAACGATARESGQTEEPREAARHPEVPPTAEDEAARAAYHEILAAYGRGDAEAYFGGFRETLDCFDDAESTSRDEVERARGAQVAANAERADTYRLATSQLVWIDSPAQGVVFLDLGSYREQGGPARPHRKVVQMVESDGRWVIAAEGGLGSRCYDRLVPRTQTEVALPASPATVDDIRALLDAAVTETDTRERERLAMERLAGPHRGIVSVAGTGELGASCQSLVAWVSIENFRQGTLTCNADLTRCVAGSYVFRFVRAGGGPPRLVAMVRYEGPAPSSESAAVERVIAQRDAMCELHDRVRANDLTLVHDELWTANGRCERVADGDAEEFTCARYCGDQVAEVAAEVIHDWSTTDLSCGPEECTWLFSGNGTGYLTAVRERGELRVAISAHAITGNELSTADERRMRRRSCPR